MPVADAIQRSSYQRIGCPTGSTRFRQIFRVHGDLRCDERMEEEVPFKPRADANKILLRLLLCRDPEGGYARYICPGCHTEHCVPFSCKIRCYLSCGKIKVDNWVNDIAKDILEAPYLHITLTADDSLRPFFLQ